ncbi:MAG TPA: FAD-binding oxidoreductase [Pyrinomonadaceae bacterium]|nr:FAD-binding oxidoreductase [Pyrinomonadaceae bacterium]
MQVKNDPEQFTDYLKDASNLSGGIAERIYFPETESEISQAVAEASEKFGSITVSGGRTGTVGSAVPFSGAVISLERLGKIISLDAEKKTIEVQPGVRLSELYVEVESRGLFYPPDPTEWSAQIGGTIATNASGSRSFKYGPTRNYVLELDLILSDGDLLKFRRGDKLTTRGGVLELESVAEKKIKVKVPTYPRPRVRKNVSGFYNSEPLDAIDLVIGSEGTLGVISRAKLRLIDRPKGFLAGIVFFKNTVDILNFVALAKEISFKNRSRNNDKNRAEIIERGKDSSGFNGIDRLDATLLEYFDDQSLRLISEKYREVPAGFQGAVFFEQETQEETEEAVFNAWEELLSKSGADLENSWFTTSQTDFEKMRKFRHALPVTVNERVVKNGQRKIGTDMAVPDAAFPSFFNYLKSSLKSSGIEYVIFGHIGDCHLHANLLPKNEAEATSSRHLYGRFIAQAIMLGGTVSAEHGIGKLKRKYLNAMYGERYLAEMSELKRCFDPKAVFGRGNVFEEKFLLG